MIFTDTYPDETAFCVVPGSHEHDHVFSMTSFSKKANKSAKPAKQDAKKLFLDSQSALKSANENFDALEKNLKEATQKMTEFQRIKYPDAVESCVSGDFVVFASVCQNNSRRHFL